MNWKIKLQIIREYFECRQEIEEKQAKQNDHNFVFMFDQSII